MEIWELRWKKMEIWKADFEHPSKKAKVSEEGLANLNIKLLKLLKNIN